MASHDSQADVIVIGAGTMGAAAAYSLARRGANVIAIDRFSPQHALGEHHGERRLFRTAYYEHPDYVPLLKRAFEGWKRLECESGESLFEVTGAVYAGSQSGELVASSIAAAEAHGIEYTSIDASAAQRLLGGLRLPAGSAALAERPAGFVRCERAVEMFGRIARKHGARVRTNERVLGWSTSAGGVEVTTDRGALRARAVIVASGPGSAGLLADATPPLIVTRQLQAWVQAGGAESPRICWAIERPDRSLLYGFPLDPQTGEVKFGVHARGESIDPEGPISPPTAGEIASLRGSLAAYFPEMTGPVRATACRYTNSPDSHFIVDRHPRDAGVIIAAGFSGHGFKFAPVVGEMLADLAISPGAGHPAPFLRLSRFGARA